jgi:hypothetical protein
MDFGLIAGLGPAGTSHADTGVPPFEFYEPARLAMGDTRRYAERIGLLDMQPRRDVASTGYALANPGSEYLVLEPYGDGRTFTVDLRAGSYTVEWFDVIARQTTAGATLTVDPATTTEFLSPFASGAAVLYLSRSGMDTSG